jgi:hypothetical protein
MAIIRLMSDDQKPKPLDDLKEGLGLLFRAAKGAVEKLPTEKVEDVAKDAVKEVGRAFETLGGEIDKAWNKATGTDRPAAKPADGATAEAAGAEKKDEEKKEEPHFDDAYAPEPPKGPRVG